MTDVLDLVDVSVVRDGKKLLAGIDWRIADGERWVVLGPNGAGKTTLLQIVAAQMHPTAGTASVLGDTLGKVDVFELRTRIGLTSAAVDARLPGREKVRDVVLSAAYGKVARWRETYEAADTGRADDLLAWWGMEGFADRQYGTLSSGERKRALVARALMTDPELLLLDEPASGLDLGGREDLVRRLANHAADPASPVTVLVTHHVEEIPPGFTHALLLRQGAVVASGPTELTLTSENLSACYGIPLQVQTYEGRYYARGL
ncbi:ABC transporter ATP-binding protein [Actinospica sp. MGRD01-02]|uniref:ABC transporter ATP-binding protein n=1 Tax=Actinospica acidithermotolerans TaxID=2828514 RepID=A0A941EHA2_9ACTN|nr:ABC transporter ATP-binding protein [Actinospica acidithermotolerans]MBR7831276.1 ABC transporter ATP-binding protein [Actinospica acidithermotolerans]